MIKNVEEIDNGEDISYKVELDGNETIYIAFDKSGNEHVIEVNFSIDENFEPLHKSGFKFIDEGYNFEFEEPSKRIKLEIANSPEGFRKRGLAKLILQKIKEDFKYESIYCVNPNLNPKKEEDKYTDDGIRFVGAMQKKGLIEHWKSDLKQ